MHFVYAVPSDQPDSAFDVGGTIEASVAAMQGWLGSQTGGPALKIDTSRGSPDVTFVRLPRSDAEYASEPEVAPAVGDDLARTGLNDQGKVYAVYYDGSAPPLSPDLAQCSQSGRTAPIAIAIVYLHDDCGYDLSSSRAGAAGALEFALLHETLEAIGFVPGCAPHSNGDGWVNDSLQDLMAPVLPDGTPILDVGNDDYFRAGIPGCLDLTQSRFLEGAGTTLSFSVRGTGRGHLRGETRLPSVAVVNCPPTCSATFDGKLVVSLQVTATAEPGSIFTGWRGACSGTEPTCLVQSDTSVGAAAQFAAIALPVRLAVAISGRGSVASTPRGIACPVVCTATFPQGAKVRLEGVPRRGWRLRGWGGACSGHLTCSVRLSRATQVRATFVRRG